MVKLLIVDDEEHLVESMKASITWKEVGIREVLSAYSGKQALGIMEQEAADIVITDVRMPGMNGIELIGEIKQKWPDTVCLLLTGHAEFEYAQEGLRHKVSHYLLKPVKDEELLAAVREVAGNMQAERERLRVYLHSQAMVHRNMPVMRANLLNNLIQGREWPEGKLDEQLRLYEIPVCVGDSVSLILIRAEDHHQYYSSSDMRIMGYAIHNIVEEMLADGYRSWSCEDIYGNLLFIINRTPDHITDQHLENLADEIRHVAGQLLHLSLAVILSPSGPFPGCLEELYQRCVATARLHTGYEGDFVVRLSAEPVKTSAHIIGPLYSPPLLPHLLEAGNWEAARGKLNEIFDEWRNKYNGSGEHLTEIYYALISAFVYFVHKNGRLLADYRLQDPLTLKGAGEMEYWAIRMLDRLQEEVTTEQSESRHSLVTQIQQYVQLHLPDDVSLQAIADHVYLHPTHVSKVFKRETGETISEYLLRLRMEKAVYLLKDSRYKVYEVAGRLGYKNPTYFIKVFKEHFGVTPQEFRE